MMHPDKIRCNWIFKSTKLNIPQYIKYVNGFIAGKTPISQDTDRSEDWSSTTVCVVRLALMHFTDGKYRTISLQPCNVQQRYWTDEQDKVCNPMSSICSNEAPELPSPHGCVKPQTVWMTTIQPHTNDSSPTISRCILLLQTERC